MSLVWSEFIWLSSEFSKYIFNFTSCYVFVGSSIFFPLERFSIGVRCILPYSKRNRAKDLDKQYVYWVRILSKITYFSNSVYFFSVVELLLTFYCLRSLAVCCIFHVINTCLFSNQFWLRGLFGFLADDLVTGCYIPSGEPCTPIILVIVNYQIL